jgi:hypothetical protein
MQDFSVKLSFATFHSQPSILCLEEEKYACTFEWLPGSIQSTHPNNETICILIENPREEASRMRGTCFFVLQHIEEHTVNTYSVAFCCRMDIRRMSPGTQKITDLPRPVYEGSMISPGSRIRIKYGLCCHMSVVFFTLTHLHRAPG